jgi:hypothetical protein
MESYTFLIFKYIGVPARRNRRNIESKHLISWLDAQSHAETPRDKRVQPTPLRSARRAAFASWWIGMHISSATRYMKLFGASTMTIS